MRSLRQLAAIPVVATVAFAQVAATVVEPATPVAGTDETIPAASSVAPDSVTAERRGEVLGGGWETSADRAIATTGDASGFHVLVADAKDGYRWRTAASLSEPGFETDSWIGNLCVTASGDRAVVVYAPRTFTNKPDLAQRAAFTAIVDLHGGPVRKLAIQTSLAYFNPGCGPTESAVLTQEGTDNSTRGGRVRVIDQGSGTGTGNRWVNIGTYMFDNVVPTVGLSNLTADGDGTQRIAWDAVAFIPVSGQYREETVEAVAVFDEDQNIGTEPPGSWLGGPLASRQDLYDWATETTGGILGLGDCPPETVGTACCRRPGARSVPGATRSSLLAPIRPTIRTVRVSARGSGPRTFTRTGRRPISGQHISTTTTVSRSG